MKKRLVSLFAVMAMLAAFAPVIANAETTIKLGDYVQMGTYYDEPILWRCVAFDKISGYDDNGNPIIDSTDTVTEYTDGYLPLMLADKIICIKPFDAKTSENEETGSHSRDNYWLAHYDTSFREFYDRKYWYNMKGMWGSNYWADSNMRSWLNSGESAGNVTWLCGNPPSEDYVHDGYNDYADEAGFLTNLNQIEQGAVKEVTQKSIVSISEQKNEMYTSGSELYKITGHDVKEIAHNYDEAYSEQVTDKMFLPDTMQICTVCANSDTLGDDYYIGSPTAKAVENSEYKPEELEAGQKWSYWLRSPFVYDLSSDASTRTVWLKGTFGCPTDYDNSGVRPAFYLSDYTIFASGEGAEENPYIVGSSTIKVTLNGEAISFDQNPVIIDGRTLVPMRAIFEAMGAEVSWDGETRTVFASKNDTAIQIAIGDNKLYVNDEAAELDVPAQIINDRTLVPIRAVSEAFGCEVDWDSETKTVIITE